MSSLICAVHQTLLGKAVLSRARALASVRLFRGFSVPGNLHFLFDEPLELTPTSAHYFTEQGAQSNLQYWKYSFFERIPEACRDRQLVLLGSCCYF